MEPAAVYCSGFTLPFPPILSPAGGLTGDFVSSIVSFDFPANVASSTKTSGMTLTVVDDDVLEDAEVFEGIFAIPVQVANQIRIRKGVRQVTSIIIEDNDGTYVRMLLGLVCEM